MAAPVRISWLIVLCFFVASCGGYSPVAISGDDGSADWENGTRTVNISPGDQVRVTLKDGTAMKGVLASSGRDSLTIDEKTTANPPSNDEFTREQATITYERHVLPLAEIEHLERYDSNIAGAVVGAVLVVGIAAGAIVGIGMANDEFMQK